MSAFDILSKILTYPQSVATGLAGYGGGGTLTGMASRSTGDEDILLAGLKGNLSPSQLGAYNNQRTGTSSVGEDILAKLGGTGLDLSYDPMLAISGVGSKAAQGTKLEGLVKGAGSFGKLEDATKLEKAGQLGRRYYQGLLATSDPLAAIPAAMGIGASERAVSKFAPAISRILAKNGGDEVAAAEAILKGPEALGFERVAGELPPAPGRGPITTNASFGSEPIVQGIKPDEIYPLGYTKPAGELPVGPRPMEAMGALPMPEQGLSSQTEALQALLGKRQTTGLTEGQRPDNILRELLGSNRSGKGKFLNAEQKALLEQFVNNPDALASLMRSFNDS